MSRTSGTISKFPSLKKAKPIRIIGIDPGLAYLGFGLIEDRLGNLVHLDHGCINTKSDTSVGKRLLDIYEELSNLINFWKPEIAGMEGLFFWKNVSSAFPVAEVKGVVRLLFSQLNIPLIEFTPTIIKQSVTGYSRADKEQVKEMVKVILKMKKIPESDHAADALAIAICRINNKSI